MKTRAAIQVEIGKPLVVDEIDLADPGPTQVVVKQFASGICHTQLHSLRSPRARIPNVLGHESTGVVVAKGRDVHHVTEGDHVILTWLPRDVVPGGPAPTAAQISYRGIPIDMSGVAGLFTWTETTIEDEQFVVKMGRDVPMDVTAIIGCAVMTGCGAVLNTANVQPGATVAVFGAGGLGLCAILACANVGAAEIIAVDIDDEKLAFTGQFGATRSINSNSVEPVAAIREITGGGVDFAFDAVGIEQTLEQSLQSIRPGVRGLNDGGTALLLGLPQKPLTLTMRALVEGRTIRGSNGGSSRPERDFPIYLDWFKSGRLPLDRLVTRRYRLEEINEACRALDEGRTLGRSIIVFDGA